MNKNSSPWAKLRSDNFKSSTLRYFANNAINIEDFLSKIWLEGTVPLAIHECGLNPFRINEISENDDNFLESIEAAEAYAIDLAEGQLYRNGMHGYEEIEEDDEGNIIKRRRKYSDRCLLEYIKSRKKSRPETTQPFKSMAIARFNSSKKAKKA